MTKFNRPLYFCTECKTVVEKVDNLIFIDEHSSKGFCSDRCIEDFYAPLINYFETLEVKRRRSLGIENENITQEGEDQNLIEEVLRAPSEVWQLENDLEESFFYYIRHFEDYTAIVICSVYHKQASFVFFKTLTRSREFIAEFRLSKESDGPLTEALSSEMSEEDYIFMQELENKKSKLLAELLIKRKESDISFEEFSNYEICYQECLDSPDEVFESKDNEGDIFFTYIKSFVKDSLNYFYIVSCLKRKSFENSDEVNVFPVLAFPTNDMDLYVEFRTGSRISGPLNN